jgi:hypothetical protein
VLFSAAEALAPMAAAEACALEGEVSAAVEAEDFEAAAALSARLDAVRSRLAGLESGVRAAEADCEAALARRVDVAAKQAQTWERAAEAVATLGSAQRAHAATVEAAAVRVRRTRPPGTLPWSGPIPILGVAARTAGRQSPIFFLPFFSCQQSQGAAWRHAFSAATPASLECGPLFCRLTSSRAFRVPTRLARRRRFWQAAEEAEEAAAAAAEHGEELAARIESRRRLIADDQEAVDRKISEATKPLDSERRALLQDHEALEEEVELLR